MTAFDVGHENLCFAPIWRAHKKRKSRRRQVDGDSAENVKFKSETQMYRKINE